MKSPRFLLLSLVTLTALACSSDPATTKAQDAEATGAMDAALGADRPVSIDAAREIAAGDATSPSDTATDLRAETANAVDAAAPDAAGPVDAALPTTNLPAPWKHVDIGDVGVVGSSELANGSYTLTGSGADIWGTTDAFTYAYRPFSGDGEVIARVVSVEMTDPWAKAGVMFRSALTPTSPHAMMIATAMNGSAFQFRPGEALESQNFQAGALTPPRWMRLVRSGNTFFGYVSSDGKDWFPLGRTDVEMPKDIYGLFTGSGGSRLSVRMGDGGLGQTEGEEPLGA